MPRIVLIVDDNVINRQMLISTLHKDYDIIEAENGKEALALMHKYYKMLSAVLLDIVMPEMDGYEVLREVRENTMLSQIPVIMVTGTEDENARVKALSLGANDFISKPFNPEIVKHCLRNNISLRETASILNAIQKDKLTGLLNREAFFEKVGVMVKDKAAGSFVLVCFDIDNFKLINDQLGSVDGDRILRDIGQFIGESIGCLGGLAGRISADNFAVLFPVEAKYTEILHELQERKSIVVEQRAIVFSIGCYLITDPELSASAIYDRAFIAKQSVKGRYDEHLAFFDETMLQQLVRDQQIVSGMEEALKEHQFKVWFQPQYNHVTGALTGAEALVRWLHPTNGLIPPGNFIPLFEQNGFVYELDKYVWREVCTYLRKWIDAGFEPLPVSVNISRYDIFRADLIDVISGLIKEYDIPIELLHLEITESAFSKSTNVIVSIVKQLIEMGFIVEIDDFGSGYSSLNTLKSVPAQVVKLDMRFLEAGDDSQRGGNILESIVRMTKWLGMSVIAEGVETREQGDFLKSVGCSYVQGYLYAKPMPAEDYESHFADANKGKRQPALETTENLDNNSFWDPTSIDSLIFNTYVGSACIMEYCDGVLEMVRVTDKYVSMLGSNKLTVEKLLKLDLMAYIDHSTLDEVREKLEVSDCNGNEIVGEILFIDLPGCSHETYVHSTMRVIARTDNRRLIYCISKNITALRTAERMEHKLTKQLQIIMDNVNIGITATAINGDNAEFLLANDKYFELLGYTKEQHRAEIGKKAYNALYPEDRKRVVDVTEQVFRTGEPTSIEYRVVRRDGSVVWLRSLLSTTDIEDYDRVVQLCTYTDITSEKNTAQILLDNLPCGAGICDVSDDHWRMTYLNRRYMTYFSHNSGIERAKSVFDVIHPNDRALLRNTMEPAFADGGEGSCVVRIMDGPDEYIPFRISGVARESLGGSNSIYVTFVPIIHEELSYNEMLPIVLEKMMASSTDLSFVKDKELRYICCSRAFAKMVGLDNESEVAGKTDYDLFDKSFADSYVADDRKLMESGKSIIDYVESIPSDDGKTKYSSTSKYLLHDSDGSVIGLYGVGHDVTHIREAEQQQKFLINSIPGGVAVYEGQWSTLESIKLAYFSDGFASLFGYTRDEYNRLGTKNPTGLVTDEFLPGLVKQIESLVTRGTAIDYVYRAKGKDDSRRWIHIKAVAGEHHGMNMTVNAVLFDVTEYQETLERLRVSEEENRLALQHSKNVVCRYDIATKTLTLSSRIDAMFELTNLIEDVPLSQISNEKISPETVGAYKKLYDGILKGEKSGNAVYQRLSTKGWRWIEAHYSTIFSTAGAPISAVISFVDVTEDFEKDVAYKKWMQSLHNKPQDTYSLFRCNISKKKVIDTVEGSLLYIKFPSGPFSFDEHTLQYAEQCVYEEDRERFITFLEVGSLLDKFEHGERIISLEYREKLPQGEDYRWLSLKVDLVEYSHLNDVEAYLLFEDIDEEKRAELLTIEHAETDPLTGLLNRAKFTEKANAIISGSRRGTRHALIMLDIDGFKLINDVFGHGAGDQALMDIANLLKTTFRRDDLVGRLGGDEFVVFLNNIPDEGLAAKKARQICELTRKTFSEEVRISGSAGIAMFPRDGSDFETLYRKADEALYYVKDSGKDNFAFYHEEMKGGQNQEVSAESKTEGTRIKKIKRRMLIVDDNSIDYQLLANLFKDEFIIDKAKDGNSALIRLRHYGSAISVVLLDLMMPGIDGFEVLETMQRSQEMQSIPVIVVSGADDSEISLRAIRDGASDFVMKPVDPDILRIRVKSAISKAENERLRAKNSFLELQNAETVRYKTVLDNIGLAVAEMDWGKGSFTYSPYISRIISGRYDGRGLWHILLSDMVADAKTVNAIQLFVHDIAGDRERFNGNTTALLNTPDGKKRLFDISVYKLVNEFGLTNKMIITFMQAESEQEE